MDFFGRVGIDWQLIAAQMINFAVLLWFLGRFLYKPLLKGMEHGDLEEAERQLEVVRQGQEKLKAERQKSLGDLKRRSAALVADAQKVAEEIKAEARQQADDEKRRLIDKTNSLLKSQLEAAEQEADVVRRRSLTESLIATWRERLADEELARPLQAAYVQALIASLRDLKPGDADQADGEITLESALASDKESVAAVHAALAATLKRKDFELKSRRNKDLIAGYRLNLDGLQVENSLLADIRHAADQE